MSIQNILPEKCRRCAKSAGPFIHKKCKICQELGFCESVLCDLNRCVQETEEFTCHAFQPGLKLVRSSVTKKDDFPDDAKVHLHGNIFRNMLNTDKIQYRKTLALQKLNRDPDSFFVELKYHFVWNVMQRKSIFSPGKDYMGFMYDTFWGCSGLVGGFVNLLWLAEDHVHIYISSDGEHSVESMAQKIKQYSENAILAEFPDIRENVGPKMKIWDEAYFAETLG